MSKLKSERLVCSECEIDIGYVIFQRWIDYDNILCMSCMEERLKKGTSLE